MHGYFHLSVDLITSHNEASVSSKTDLKAAGEAWRVCGIHVGTDCCELAAIIVVATLWTSNPVATTMK